MTFAKSDRSRDKATEPAFGRKRYRAPSLVVYGSLARITDAVTFMGNLDGGMVVAMRRSGG